MTEEKATLRKAERLHKRSIINKLFKSGSKSFPIFPIRTVFMPVKKDGETPVSILISVPKRLFKRAVKRNRIKRQIREAFRKNKHILHSALQEKPYNLVIAFIWLDKELHESTEIEDKMKSILYRIAEKDFRPLFDANAQTTDAP